MNKTVNINLAGTFFHIDEDAYQKLQRYIEAIKRSFTDSEGREEIIADIEARISELFFERVDNDRQVVSNALVEDIIAIMGQPEDYLVDEEIFEDEPVFKSKAKQESSSKSKSSSAGSSSKTHNKKLFRDRDNSYVAGVCSGLGHYLGIDSIWIRLIWLFLTLGSGGTFTFIYVLFWVLVPEATSTSEKLQMTGEPVNISNIEKKIKDGITTVTDTVKNVDFQKHTDDFIKGVDQVTENITKSVDKIDFRSNKDRVKSGSRSFFDSVGNVIKQIFKVFGKFFGAIILFVAAVTLISLVVGLLSFGDMNTFLLPNMNINDLSMHTSAPTWLLKLITFGAVGIPFFFLFYLGLKLIASNSKSISGGSKFTLFFLWILSIASIGSFGIKEGFNVTEKTSFSKKVALPTLTKSDTIYLDMNENDYYDDEFRRRFKFKRFVNEDDETVYVSRGVRLIVKSTSDSIAKIKVEKFAQGSDYTIAKERAERISYNYNVNGKTINLDSYFEVDRRDKSRKQEVIVTLYLPTGSVFYGYESTYAFHRNESEYNDIFDNGSEELYQKVKRSKLVPMADSDDIDNDDIDNDDNDEDETIDNEVDSKIKIDDDGVEIKTDSAEIKIDESGLQGETKSVKVNIDEDGVKITSKKEN
jgi:phage shock protein PspC (stress-responsive transcriptional regulator)